VQIQQVSNLDTMDDELKGLATHENLKRAFLREAGNAHRYLYFARIAEIEGFPAPAQLFRDLAESCLCNAHGNLDFLKRVGDPATDLPIGESEDNLLAAITSATGDSNDFYPQLTEAAHQEGQADIANWFATMERTSRNHSEKLHRALTQLRATLGQEEA